jgi:cell division protein FtsX
MKQLITLNFTGPSIIVFLLLSVIFFFVSLTGLTNPQLFKRKNSLKVPNKFILFLVFFLFSIGCILIAAGVFATQIHKRPIG